MSEDRQQQPDADQGIIKCESCRSVPARPQKCVCQKVFYCSKACQKIDWKNHKSNCPPFLVRETSVGGKGRGLFAARNLSRGSVVLTEEPTLQMDSNGNDEYKIARDFYKLSPEVQTRVLSLHDPTPDNRDSAILPKLCRIMNFNSCRKSNFVRETVYQNLYLTNSFINHSCRPNCCWKPSEDSDKMSVMTLIPVQKGEEITVNYYFSIFDERGSYCLTWRERKELINKHFAFDCLCNLCQKADKDDSLRREYQKLDRELDQEFYDMESTMKHFEIAENKLKLGRKLDNQILFRDLMDCIILLKCLMEIVPYCKDYLVRYGELKDELERIIRVYPDGFADKLRGQLKIF